MADTQLQAMIARFDQSPAYGRVAASGGLHFGEIPEGRALPFAAMAHGGVVDIELTTEDPYVETDVFTFFIMATSIVTVESIATDVKKAFDLPETNQASAALPVSQAFVIECCRTGYSVAVDPTDDPTGASVYTAVIPYRVRTRKTLRVS